MRVDGCARGRSVSRELVDSRDIYRDQALIRIQRAFYHVSNGILHDGRDVLFCYNELPPSPFFDEHVAYVKIGTDSHENSPRWRCGCAGGRRCARCDCVSSPALSRFVAFVGFDGFTRFAACVVFL